MALSIITMTSLTQAMKAKQLLEKQQGIRSDIRKLDGSLTQYGCSYGLWIPTSLTARAVRFLQDSGLSYGRVL